MYLIGTKLVAGTVVINVLIFGLCILRISTASSLHQPTSTLVTIVTVTV